MQNINKALIVLLFLVVIFALGFYSCKYQGKGGVVNNGSNNGSQIQPAVVVNNFDECVAANYPVEESYPRRCKTPDNTTFTEDIGNEVAKTDLIQVSSPRPNDTVQSPLKITGQARGRWFFEASFPIKIYDATGKELGTAIAQAKSDWMTDQFVPFEATITFEKSTTTKGNLILQKDNPSGLAANDDSLRIPVVFGKSN